MLNAADWSFQSSLNLLHKSFELYGIFSSHSRFYFLENVRFDLNFGSSFDAFSTEMRSAIGVSLTSGLMLSTIDWLASVPRSDFEALTMSLTQVNFF